MADHQQMPDTKQEMSDVPRTPEQYKRQRGPIPMAAIVLAVGLVLAFMLFFLPMLTAGSTGPTP